MKSDIFFFLLFFFFFLKFNRNYVASVNLFYLSSWSIDVSSSGEFSAIFYVQWLLLSVTSHFLWKDKKIIFKFFFIVFFLFFYFFITIILISIFPKILISKLDLMNKNKGVITLWKFDGGRFQKYIQSDVHVLLRRIYGCLQDIR